MLLRAFKILKPTKMPYQILQYSPADYLKLISQLRGWGQIICEENKCNYWAKSQQLNTDSINSYMYKTPSDYYIVPQTFKAC